MISITNRNCILTIATFNQLNTAGVTDAAAGTKFDAYPNKHTGNVVVRSIAWLWGGG